MKGSGSGFALGVSRLDLKLHKRKSTHSISSCIVFLRCVPFFCRLQTQVELAFILLVILCIAVLIQLFYYLFIFNLLAYYRESEVKTNDAQPPVSVIVCARNEAENLENNLPLLLEQDYPSFEVILVNDGSYDETEELLKVLCKKYKQLKVVDVNVSQSYEHGKKYALTMGIKAAANEYLLFTDADCLPAGKEWIASMMQRFNPGTEIVLGFSQYKAYFGLLNRFIRFETFFTGLQYLSYSLYGKTYMGVGRNLAYTKSLFFNNKGFASHLHIMAGDDDLFVNENATATNTAIQPAAAALTWSEPKRTFAQYVRQKFRHHNVSKHYKAEHKFLLSLFSVSGIFFYGMFIALACMQFMPEVVIGVFVARLLLQLIIFRSAMKKLACLDLWWQTPLLDFLYSLYMLTVAPLGLIRKLKRWK